MFFKRIGSLLLLAFALGLAIPAMAGDTGWDWNLDIQVRYEDRDNYDLTDGAGSDANGLLIRTRFTGKYSFDTNWKLVFKVQDSRTTGDLSFLRGVQAATDLHVAYLQYSKGNHTLKFGRLNLVYGEQRLIGGFEWDNVARSFDGIEYQYKIGNMDNRAFAARLGHARKGGIDRPENVLVGWHSTWKVGDHLLEALAVHTRMERRLMGEDGRLGSTSLFTVSGRHAWSKNKFSCAAELVLQRGRVKGVDHTAWAYALWAKVKFGDGWFGIIGTDAASGDGDSTDGESREFQNLFPTNHLHYGAMDLFGWRNLQDYYVKLGWAKGKWKVIGSFYDFSLENSSGRWSHAGGATMGWDSTGLSGSHVGSEFDLVASFKANKKLSVGAGLGWFNPGHFADSVRGDDSAQFAYLMVKYKFR